jgi:anaerobic magnesium-protoporphyrin IX monomethyl ester cyclase
MPIPQRVLLINPPGTRRVYLETNVRAGAPILPPLGLAAISGALARDNHDVRVLDLDLADVSGEPADALLTGNLASFAPDIAGLTSITPTWHETIRIAKEIKTLRPRTVVVCGGLHATLFPEETLASGAVDIVIRGEADFALNELILSGSPADVPGAVFLKNGKPEYSAPRTAIEDLDTLPFPAWEKFETSRYHMSHLTERQRPGGYIETSRGCPFGCIYCDKTIFVRRFRAKSPDRVVAEIEAMLRIHKFRELHIVDDGFSTDLGRAKEICRLIVSRGLKFNFNLFNGVRADRLDDELCGLLKRAGCWQVAFGIESGSDHVLESVSKGLSKDDIRRAVGLCKKHRLETFGFFMIGFPEDTAETIVETINFAVELDMTISKYDIAVPLPGTPMFETLDRKNLIKTRDWSRYIFHQTKTPLFEHPNLTWEQIDGLYYLAYRKTYLRLRYIVKRFAHGLRTRGLWHNVVYFLKSRWR